MPKTRIKRCEACGGPIGPDFYILKMSQAFVNYDAVERQAALEQYFRWYPGLAEAFSPGRSFEVVVQGDDANNWPELVICQSCCIGNPIIVMIFEKFGKDAIGK